MKTRLPEDKRIEIGKRLRSIRTGLKLDQTKQAEQHGITQANISYYEKGMTEPPLTFLLKLREHGVSIDWIVAGEGTMKTLAASIKIKKTTTGETKKFLAALSLQ